MENFADDCRAFSQLMTDDASLPGLIRRLACECFRKSAGSEPHSEFSIGLDAIVPENSKNLILGLLRHNGKTVLDAMRAHASPPAYQFLRQLTLSFGRKMQACSRAKDDLESWEPHLARHGESSFLLRCTLSTTGRHQLRFAISLPRLFGLLADILTPLGGFYARELSTDESLPLIRHSIRILTQLERRIAMDRGEEGPGDAKGDEK